jgi:hypothetical protein
MKKIITILAMTLVVSTSFASVEPETVPNQALNTFSSEICWSNGRQLDSQ